ncbi:MAG: MmgE/PrpD family protein [Chloroflexi bacterium]|nr:MmgE/PrpD family protein [Chloroflexota bacterium]
MTLEEQLVGHLRGTSFLDLPGEAVDAARREVLWNLGTSVAGAGAPGSREIMTFVRQAGGREEATVVGFGDRVPANLAGLANGTFGKALEYEDKFWIGEDHGFGIGMSVVPAAFAVAEHLGRVDGKALLRAVALATDIEGRMIIATKAGPGSVTPGWNVGSTLSALGASMVAGALMGLSEEQLLNAMGLAYAQTTGSYQAFRERVLAVRMQTGFGVRNGITAAQLARAGVTGPKLFLTGQFGLYRLFFMVDEPDTATMTQDLGRQFLGTRLGFKAYPCGAVAHPVLDAILSLMDQHNPPLESIEQVCIHGTSWLYIMVEPRELKQNPQSHVDSEFSLPWAVACAIVDRKLSPAHFRDEALKDGRYVQVARKVETFMDRDWGAYAEIRLRDGRTLRSVTVRAAKGHPDNPQTTEELVERYRECVKLGPKPLMEERTEEAKDLVLRLQEAPDVSKVMKLLS